MTPDEHTLNYEDFVIYLSKYLKDHEKEFIEYSVDPFSPLASVNREKLANKLSYFWYTIND